MSKTIRRNVIYCNERFIEIQGELWWSILYYPISIKQFSFPVFNNIIGNTLILCLNDSKELTNDEWDRMFGVDYQGYMSSTKEKEERDILTIKKYGYRDSKSIYKNMHSCSLHDNGKKLEIRSLKRGKRIDSYEKYEGDGIEDIYIKTNTPPELLGAAVRYAFTRCKGKGLDVVTKALFSDGVPNSLEEYLESIDPDYKKWLVSA